MYALNPSFSLKTVEHTLSPIHVNFLSFSLKPNTSKVIFGQVSKDFKYFQPTAHIKNNVWRFSQNFFKFCNSWFLSLIFAFLALLAFSWLGCELGSCYRVVVIALLHNFRSNLVYSDFGSFWPKFETLEISWLPHAIDSCIETQTLLWQSRNKTHSPLCPNLIKSIWVKLGHWI